jgi:hypothetical protein
MKVPEPLPPAGTHRPPGPKALIIEKLLALDRRRSGEPRPHFWIRATSLDDLVRAADWVRETSGEIEPLAAIDG